MKTAVGIYDDLSADLIDLVHLPVQKNLQLIQGGFMYPFDLIVYDIDGINIDEQSDSQREYQNQRIIGQPFFESTAVSFPHSICSHIVLLMNRGMPLGLKKTANYRHL